MSGFNMTPGLVLQTNLTTVDEAGREVRVWKSPDAILTVTTRLTDFDPPGPEGDGGCASYESNSPVLGAPGRMVEVDSIPVGDVILDHRPVCHSITMRTNTSGVARQPRGLVQLSVVDAITGEPVTETNVEATLIRSMLAGRGEVIDVPIGITAFELAPVIALRLLGADNRYNHYARLTAWAYSM